MVVSLIDALQSTFPAIHRLVGNDYFAAAARAYIEAHPPDSPVLLRYGRDFGGFIDKLPSASGVPYLGDVARLEWARVNALHAPDAEPVSIHKLAGVPETVLESVTLMLHPSLGLVDSRWPVVSLWSACRGDGEAGDVDMDAPEQAVVVRPQLKVDVHSSPAGGGGFLDALSRGSSLGTAAQRATEETAEFDLAAQLQFAFQIGAVVAVNLPE